MVTGCTTRPTRTSENIKQRTYRLDGGLREESLCRATSINDAVVESNECMPITTKFEVAKREQL